MRRAGRAGLHPPCRRPARRVARSGRHSPGPIRCPRARAVKAAPQSPLMPSASVPGTARNHLPDPLVAVRLHPHHASTGTTSAARLRRPHVTRVAARHSPIQVTVTADAAGGVPRFPQDRSPSPGRHRAVVTRRPGRGRWSAATTRRWHASARGGGVHPADRRPPRPQPNRAAVSGDHRAVDDELAVAHHCHTARISACARNSRVTSRGLPKSTADAAARSLWPELRPRADSGQGPSWAGARDGAVAPRRGSVADAAAAPSAAAAATTNAVEKLPVRSAIHPPS
jgi:hypothetical protein